MFDLESLSEADRIQVSERLEELTHLVRLISLRPELTMVVGEPDSPWSFSFRDNRVSAPVNDLINESADYCRGLTLHEAAHATVTRIFDLIHPSVVQRRAYHSLFNVIEDCRIETWIMERSPGAVPWIKEYNDKLFTPFLERPLPQSLSAQYLSSVLSEWWFKKRPDHLDERVMKALDDTQPFIDKAIDARPPVEVGRLNLYSDVYAQNRSLSIIYLTSDYQSPPSDFEKAVRLRQLQMVIEVTRHIFPVYDRLLLIDQEENQPKLEEELKELLDHLRGDHLNVSGRSPQDTQGAEGCQPNQGQGTSPSNQDSAQSSATVSEPPQALNDQSGPYLPNPHVSDHQLRQALNRALDIDPNDKYLKVWKSLSNEIHILGQELIRVIEARVKPKWVRGYAAGTRLDLRQAMAFEADPKLYQRLWMKQTKPNKIEPAFIILLDISGSMEGNHIKGAFSALVVLVEVCARLHIPLEIISFNNQVKLIKEWEESITEELRSRLAQLLAQTGSSTRLSLALDLAQERLQYLPFKDRFIITLSDGEPNEPELVRERLKDMSQGAVHCLGVGIGSGTRSLKQFFSDGIYEVTPMQLATQLGGLLDRLLRQ